MFFTRQSAMAKYYEIEMSGGLPVLQKRWYGWHVSEYISHF